MPLHRGSEGTRTGIAYSAMLWKRGTSVWSDNPADHRFEIFEGLFKKNGINVIANSGHFDVPEKRPDHHSN